MAGIANTDANFAGFDAFLRKCFGRAYYLGDVSGDGIPTLTGGTPGDWQTTHLGSSSTVKFVNRDLSVATITDTEGEALGIAVNGKAAKL
jgi:hypothetical protein